MKLSFKILTATLVPFLVIIGLFHLHSNSSFTSYLVDIYRQQADEKLYHSEEDIRGFLRTQENDLKLLATITPPDINRSLATKIAFRGLMQQGESFFQISAVNANGKEWLRINKFPEANEEQQLVNLFSQAIYQRPMLDLSTYLGPLEFLPEFTLPFLNISVPVKSHSTGQVSGLIWAKISFQGIQDILERALPSQGKIMLLHAESGKVLAQADDTRTDFSSQEQTVVDQLPNSLSRQGWLEEGDRDRKATFIFRKFVIKDVPFLLIYYQPNNTIFFLANQLKRFNLYVLFSGVFIFIVSSFILIRTVITPLMDITSRISKLSQQYLPKKSKQPQAIAHDSGDEVGQLRFAFSSFQDQLQQYRHEIELFNQTLEQQIQQKTQELADVNKALEKANDALLRDIDKRLIVEKELESYQQHLEQKVRDRTAELSQANISLQQEIEDRRSAQLDLAAEKEQLAVTLRSIGDGVITTDIQGQIVLLNTVAEKLTGWTQEKAVGRPLQEVFSFIEEKSSEPCENLLGNILHSDSFAVPARQGYLVCKDNMQRLISNSGAPIYDKESKAVGVVLVFRDITELQRMQEDLLKIRKLESVGLLAGGIAHDFNNILTAIIGNLSLATYLVSPEDKIHKLLKDAEKASQRAKQLTMQLLTFSKGGEPVKDIASMEDILQDSANFVLRGSNVRCEFAIADDLLPVVVDAGQISQVIQNIIINGRHAMPTGGTIEVCCKNIEITEEQEHSLLPGFYVQITISDQGIGIPAKILSKIFDPYFTTKNEGSGLGLAITHSIINKHGGSISVVSEQAKGTTFTILLPASTNTKTVASRQQVLHIEKGKGKILIMDDETIIQVLAEEMLTFMGYDVTLSKDGTETIELYRTNKEKGMPFDLVFMDLTIQGGMGGKEAITQLLEMDPEAKVIVSSGYSSDPVMSDYKKYGFKGVLHKPFNITDISHVISEVLDQ